MSYPKNRASRRPPVERRCEYCGATFMVLASYLKRDAGRFCTRACYDAIRGQPECPAEFKTAPPLASLPDRFWSRVRKAGDCWLWTGTTTSFGYGELRVDGVDRSAHRVSYEMAKGPIPAGYFVLHRCDNPPCVRPDHLFVGTQADNVADMIAKGRMAKPSRAHPERLPRGEKHWNAKLTESDVIAIRIAVARGARLRQLADDYGVVYETVREIVKGQNWAHVHV